MFFLKTHYHRTVQKDLILTDIVKTVYEVPKTNKISLSLSSDNKSDSSVVGCLFVSKVIGGQKPFMLKQRPTNGGKVIGGKITLRNTYLYSFLYKLVTRSLPNLNNFEGLELPIHHNTFTFILKDIFVFDELKPLFPYLEDLGPLQCQLHLTTKEKQEVFMLTSGILFLF